MRRALVTRPAPLAGRTARRLEEMGFVPVLLPLSETRPLAVDAAAIPAGAGAIAVTSANAILNAPRDLLRGLVLLPCFAVGGATAAAARAAGFRSVIEGSGDAAGLARMLVAAGNAAPAVYLCGRVRRPDFEATLAAAGRKPVIVETYDTAGIRHDSERAAAAIGGDALAAALVYSASAAESLDELAGRPELSRLFEGTAFCCLSARIAGALKAGARRKILVAKEPTEEALLSMLSGPGKRLHHASSFLEPMV